MGRNGFSKKGKCFYSIRNDIAFCVELDCPSGSLYASFYLVPLYMPAFCRYYTYGNRFDYLSESSMPCMGSESTEKQQEKWIEGFTQEMQNLILPFFDRVSHPDKLAQYIASTHILPDSYIFCPEIAMHRLLLFTYSYLNKNEEITSQTHKMQQEIKKCSFLSPKILNDYWEETKELILLRDATDIQRDLYFQKIIHETRTNCF